jgi:tRNA (adenine37-N6)-methyltransferase
LTGQIDRLTVGPPRPMPAPTALTLTPIGVIHTPFKTRLGAPRQPCAAEGVKGTIELYPRRNFEHALSDIEQWDHLWVLFWFHLNSGWRPKVLPPRSEKKRRGVFATRAPYRPNPIGLSVVRLERVEGLTLHVCNVDMVDGTPVLDIKPYLPVSDAIPTAKSGWLAPDPAPAFEVSWSERAREQTEWLREEHGLDLVPEITQILVIGPQPHPYRRIRREGDGLRLALHEWRVFFRIEGRHVTVGFLKTGYRPAQLKNDPALRPHREFTARFA